MIQNPIFVALDTNDVSAALDVAQQVSAHVGGIKLGLEFFNANGPDGIAHMGKLGVPVFLDLKLHDIPNTVAGALRSLGALSATPLAFLTLHAQGGSAMIAAAAQARDEVLPDLKLLAVTVLTSLDETDLAAMGVAGSAEMQVQRLGKLATGAGADGLVCSPKEVAGLRRTLGPDVALMVPGIRPKGSAQGDQKRVMTPADAITAGASHLVIGRPITQAEDPAAAASAIAASLSAP